MSASAELASPQLAEEWRPVVGYEGAYEVSDLGRVRSLDRPALTPTGFPYVQRGRVLKRTRVRAGESRFKVNLSVPGIPPKKRLISTLVAAAFLGPRPDGFFVCHNNGKADDDRLVNLRYDTPTGNSADTIPHGTRLHLNDTGCLHGHPWNRRNTYIARDGSRVCRTCHRDWARRRRHRERLARARAE